MQSKAFGDDDGYNIDIPDFGQCAEEKFLGKIGFRIV